MRADNIWLWSGGYELGVAGASNCIRGCFSMGDFQCSAEDTSGGGGGLIVFLVFIVGDEDFCEVTKLAGGLGCDVGVRDGDEEVASAVSCGKGAPG